MSAIRSQKQDWNGIRSPDIIPLQLSAQCLTLRPELEQPRCEAVNTKQRAASFGIRAQTGCYSLIPSLLSLSHRLPFSKLSPFLSQSLFSTAVVNMTGARHTFYYEVDFRKITCTLFTKDKSTARLRQLRADWEHEVQESEARFASERTMPCNSQDMRSKKTNTIDLSCDNSTVRFAIQLIGTPTHVTDQFIKCIEELARDLVVRKPQRDLSQWEGCLAQQETDLVQRENDLVGGKERVVQEEYNLVQGKNNLEQRQKELGQKEKEYEQRKRNLEHQEAESKQLEQRLQQQGGVLQRRETDLDKRESNMNRQEADLLQREKDVRNQDENLQRRKTDLDKRERDLEPSERTIGLTIYHGDHWQEVQVTGNDPLYAVAAAVYHVRRSNFTLRRLSRSIKPWNSPTADSVSSAKAGIHQ